MPSDQSPSQALGADRARVAPRLVPLNEAVEVLGITRWRAYSLMAAGILPSVRIDGRVLVPAEQLGDVAERLAAEEAKDARCLSPEAAAQALGIGRNKVFELIGDGRLGSMKVGKRRLIPVVAIDEYVDRLRAEQAAS